MAARRSQRRRGRRGEPGTALLAPFVLGLGLALACLGLLLAAVSLRSWASLPAQVRPAAHPALGTLVAETAEEQMGLSGQRARALEGGRRARCQVEDRVTLPPSQQEPSQGELMTEEDEAPPVSRCWLLCASCRQESVLDCVKTCMHGCVSL
jgi:hypothetical protein